MRETVASEIDGLEYDWLASDEEANVALFSTAGRGAVPRGFVRDTDAHDEAIRAILAMPPTTTARFAPSVADGRENTWRAVAERGLYAFDGDPAGGPYRLVAAPAVAVSAEGLPQAAAELVRRIVFRRVRFSRGDAIPDELVSAIDENQWLPIRYADFHDVPRAFLVEHDGAAYFFDCPFDDQLDDYPDAYQVFRIEDEHRAALADSVPWRRLRSMATFVATIPVRDVELDPTRRASVSRRVLAGL